ncbi:MAG: hypothetical protein ATN34_02395 [Epulopiscium sp. Nele67-Bin002]|nr:MAG: hypothetical protein ATN34_02395 [Epulopiscium sp. Nele67-Bin002]
MSKEFWLKVLNLIFILAVIYLFITYIFGLIAPFVVAWLLASLLNPIVTILTRNIKLSRGIATLLSMITVLSALLSLITMLVKQLYGQVLSFAQDFPIYRQNIQLLINTIEEQLLHISQVIPIPDAFTSIGGILEYILQSIEAILPMAYTVVSHVPSSIFFVVITLIATFFMTKDYNWLKAFVKAQLSPSSQRKVGTVKNRLKGALGGYVKTQLILMCCTFTICLIGLTMLQRDYVLLVSVGIAIFDAFPMLGSGAILITWAVYYLILGNVSLGVGLLCIYGIIVVMRQVLEPRVLSGQLGMYALVTIMALYIGLQVLGPIGIIVGPIIAVIIQTLQSIEIIPQFKEVDDKDLLE